MLITFFDFNCNKFTLNKFRNACQTVDQAHYVEILKRLYEAVRTNRPELWPNDWILHHENSPAHKTLSIKQFMAQKSITEMEHPPYSPDLALNDF
jgi:histone-lysine N-methyltransferase SETMAR